MKKLILFVLVGFFCAPVSHAVAQEDGYSFLFEESLDNPQPRAAEIPFDNYGGVKDSFFFMKDDGEFSDAEKDEEATYIYHRCLKDGTKRKFYDCACIAGKFRAERDKPDLVPQSLITSKIYNDPENKCINSTGIAGSAYDNCMNFSKVFRDRNTEEENESYCQCVANSKAKKFAEDPKLNLRHIEKITTAANLRCKRLEKRSLF